MLSFFPLDVLDEIRDLIGSVSEGFLTYSLICKLSDLRIRSNHNLEFNTHLTSFTHLVDEYFNKPWDLRLQ